MLDHEKKTDIKEVDEISEALIKSAIKEVVPGEGGDALAKAATKTKLRTKILSMALGAILIVVAIYKIYSFFNPSAEGSSVSNVINTTNNSNNNLANNCNCPKCPDCNCNCTYSLTPETARAIAESDNLKNNTGKGLTVIKKKPSPKKQTTDKDAAEQEQK